MNKIHFFFFFFSWTRVFLMLHRSCDCPADNEKFSLTQRNRIYFHFRGLKSTPLYVSERRPSLKEHKGIMDVILYDIHNIHIINTLPCV